MPQISLPDGSQRQFDAAVTVADIAADIGPGLAKAVLAGEVDGKLVDLAFLIENDATVSIITEKQDEGLEIIRHSTAHLLAQAVKALFPTAQVTIGPVIEDGFFYDFAFQRSFTPEDLERIEEKMHELAKEDATVTRQEMPRDEAVKYFRGLGEEYKAKIIEDIPADEVLSLYNQGDFTDLCRGPHVPNIGRLKHFKLMKLAGAYWRGNSDNEMLQRIYGTAWASKKDLKDYLFRLEEAEKRDHRKLGKQLNLFHTQEEAPGMIFWHPNGWTLYRLVEGYIRNALSKDYQEIRTPQILSRVLWEKSGHWEKYSEEMFTTQSESHDFAIKPMSCPCHIQVFKEGIKSYRDLPIRYSEFGCCHRNEPSGTLHGLMRVRQFVQDDAHIFCTDDQLQNEVAKFLELVFKVYADFGFEDIIVNLSTRPEKRVGSDEIWDRAEADLQTALEQSGLEWSLNPGNGAFYGPKIDFSLRDSIGRIWQCGTLQCDYSLPERLGAHYIAEDSSKQVPVMLHRAITGSLERFIGVLIEHYAGKLPVHLAPIQVIVMNISNRHADFVRKTTETLQNRRLRANFDLRNEKIGFKIRECTLQKVPYLLVVGDRECENQTVAVRARDGEDLGSMTIEQFIERIEAEVPVGFVI